LGTYAGSRGNVLSAVVAAGALVVAAAAGVFSGSDGAKLKLTFEASLASSSGIGAAVRGV
jgi:hypothetical protein